MVEFSVPGNIGSVVCVVESLSMVSCDIVVLTPSDLAVVPFFVTAKLSGKVVCDVVWPTLVVPCRF